MTEDDATNEAIERAGTDVNAAWSKAAFDVVVAFPPHRQFTTDAVWEALALLDIPEPAEPRAMGTVMSNLAHANIIFGTRMYENTKRPQAHRRPIRVWARTTERST